MTPFRRTNQIFVDDFIEYVVWSYSLTCCVLPIIYRHTSKYWTETHYLNDNIARCKPSRVVKDLSNSGSFFLWSFPKYLDTILFYSLYMQISRIFWKISFTKKFMDLERLFRKDKPSQNLLKLLASVKTCLGFKFPTSQNFKFSSSHNFIIRE